MYGIEDGASLYWVFLANMANTRWDKGMGVEVCGQ